MPYAGGRESANRSQREYYQRNKKHILEKQRERYQKNPKPYLEYSRQRIQEKAKYERELKDIAKCLDCGVDYPHYVMEFDHARGERKFTISGSGLSRSWETVLDEIDKCDIVCANCHKARTRQRANEETGGLK